jgi:hypothetical protein
MVRRISIALLISAAWSTSALVDHSSATPQTPVVPAPVEACTPPGPCPLANWSIDGWLLSGTTPKAVFDTTLMDPDFFTARLQFDHAAGTALSSISGQIGGANLWIRDVFAVEGIGTAPVTFRARLSVTVLGDLRCNPSGHCDHASASVTLVHGADQVRTTEESFRQVLELSLTKSDCETFELETRLESGVAAFTGAFGRATSVLEFLDLPPGARVTSCHGFIYDVATPVQVSVAETRVAHDRVRIDWYVPQPGLEARVLRSDAPGNPAVLREVVPASGAGRVTFEETQVVPGATYVYMLGLPDRDAKSVVGHVSITIPHAPSFGIRLIGRHPARAGAEVLVTTLSDMAARLTAFDVSGRRVGEVRLPRSSVSGTRVRLDDLSMTRPGVYLLELTQGAHRSSRSVVVSR